MYSESDLQSAIESGAISREAADALRAHVARMRASPVVDEEHFRLLTGFNDIFVSIAAVILLVAVAWLGGSGMVAGALVAAVSWGLAEYFTRIRRMALPSIVLLIGFAGGMAAALGSLAGSRFPDAGDRTGMALLSLVALGTAVAIWFHWKRFMVPITVAVGAGACAALGVSLLLAALPRLADHMFLLLLLAGIGIFLLAMRWDMSDRGRTTRRSDVAFWLHLTAAPMIAHSLFQLLGVFDGEMNGATAAIVLTLYLIFGIVALAIDRRALLVSSLAYVLWALTALFRHVGAVELSFAFTALVIGSALLLLSAFWHRARALVVGALPPALQGRLPYLDRPTAA